MEETKAFILLIIEEQKTETTNKYVFTVFEKSNTDFIGMIGINLGRAKYRNAEIWFKYLPNFWNKGFGTEAMKKIIDFGFTNLKLHRIEAGCAIDNIGSQKVIEKCELKKESHTRKLLPLKTGWSDSFKYAIFKTDLE